MAVVRSFEKLGIPLMLSKVFDDGRASQSQGLVEITEKRAIKLASYLEKFTNEGKDIIIAEPSVLASFRFDYKKLINNEKLFLKLAEHTFDPIDT